MDLNDIPDAGQFREYAPVRVQVPETAFEVVAQDGRIFYDLGTLSRDLKRTFTAMGIQTVISGSESECAFVSGMLNVVDVLTAMNDGLTEWAITN